jgi:acyl transferase domain-containing protein
VKRGQPNIPFVSNLTGTWISAEDAGDPQYWAKHLRHTVRFGDGIKELLKNRDAVLLEVGPGTTLSSLAKFQPEQPPSRAIVSCLPRAREQRPDVPCLLTALGQLWLHGVKVDWSGFYAHERRRRIPLPTYPFQRERYWIEAGQSESTKPSPRLPSRKNPDVADWFYIPSWKRSLPRQPIATPARQQNWLVFLDECGLGSSVAERLEQYLQSVIKVRAGMKFELASDGSFILNPSLPEDYERLMDELQQKRKLPQRVAHFWSVTPDLPATRSEAESFQQYRSLGFDSLLFLAQAIYKHGISDVIRMNFISNNVQDVIGGEPLCPGKAALLGPCKVVSQEHRNLICRSMDVVLEKSGTAGHKRLVEQLVAELLSEDSTPVIAYRGSYRWVQEFEHIRLAEPTEAKTKLRERGVYLITGGLGKIGLVLAEFLAKNHRARLILMGRSGLPRREEWANWLDQHGPKDNISLQIQKVQELEAMGGEVMVLAVNVADKEQVAAGISAACQRFGEINGVFHGAGIAGRQSSAFIPDVGKAQCDMHFQPKVHGVQVLEDVLRDKKLDFIVLLSSLSTVLGGLGMAAYSGANHFMDAFALSRRRLDGTPWISVNWDGWRNEKASESSSTGPTITEFSLAPAEGIEAFRRILSETELGRVIVSTGDLNSRLDLWVSSKALEAAAPSKPEEASQLHPRPNVRSGYVPAQNETERVIANIWEALFGIEKVGVDDNFFDLGGDSLLLLRVQAMIGQTFGANLSSAEMFQHPTISALARRVSQPAAESAGLAAVQDRAQLQRAALARQVQTTKHS